MSIEIYRCSNSEYGCNEYLTEAQDEWETCAKCYARMAEELAYYARSYRLEAPLYKLDKNNEYRKYRWTQ